MKKLEESLTKPMAVSYEIHSGLCANGDLRDVDPWTIIGGTGRYAGAKGSFTTDQCSNLVTGETSGTIVVRGH